MKYPLILTAKEQLEECRKEYESILEICEIYPNVKISRECGYLTFCDHNVIDNANAQIEFSDDCSAATICHKIGDSRVYFQSFSTFENYQIMRIPILRKAYTGSTFKYPDGKMKISFILYDKYKDCGFVQELPEHFIKQIYNRVAETCMFYLSCVSNYYYLDEQTYPTDLLNKITALSNFK